MANAEHVEERTQREAGQIVMPFYIVCDVSWSMAADMSTLNEALGDLRQEIVSEPLVDDVARIAILTFSDSAQVVAPLAQVSESGLPTLRDQGGTNYGEAFRTLAQTIEQDRASLKSQGYKIYRPCAFFLTDGEPQDHDYAQTFRSTLTYDSTSGQGMAAHPIFVPFGFRDAREDVLRQLAYPPEKGKWFLARTSNVKEALAAVLDIIMKTVVSSGRRAASGTTGAVQIADPAADANISSGVSEFI